MSSGPPATNVDAAEAAVVAILFARLSKPPKLIPPPCLLSS